MKRSGFLGLLAIAGLAVATCGGKQDKGSARRVGDSHAADDLDIDEGSEVGELGGGDAGAGESIGAMEPGAEAPPVTFELVNAADEDLVLSLDRGWQPVISAYSGEPPNAKPILMFPTHCTAACDVPQEERCPYCPKAKDAKEEKESENRKVVPAGESLKVPWDGQIYIYERTKGIRDGKKKKCNCYRVEQAPENTYTVRACGLRITKSAKRTSSYQCPTSTMTLPSDTPQVVRFEFETPPKKEIH